MTYDRLYNWQNDRDAGVPIMAERMDAEFDAIEVALDSLVVTQTNGEWVVFPNSVLYVSASSFKVSNDYSATFHVGRRIKAVVAGGTFYGTIRTVSFSAGFTTVVVDFDGAGALTNPITSVYYGLLSYTSPSYLDPRSFSRATLGADLAVTGGGGNNYILFDTSITDTLSEYSAVTGKFTAKKTGLYWVRAKLDWVPTAVANIELQSILNTSTETRIGVWRYHDTNSASGSIIPLHLTDIVPLAAGEYLRIAVAAGTGNNGNVRVGSNITVVRIV